MNEFKVASDEFFTSKKCNFTFFTSFKKTEFSPKAQNFEGLKKSTRIYQGLERVK